MFHPSYPDVLVKITENDLALCGQLLTRSQFLKGMNRCGFNIDYTIRTLNGVRVGGKWFLSLSDKQKRLIFNDQPSSQSDLGFN